MTRAAVLGVLTTALAVLLAAPAAALIQSAASASQDVATATLSPPSAPKATLGQCSPRTGDSIVVSWTATPSTRADGYQVWRSTTTGGPYTLLATVAGRDTTSYTDAGLSFAKQYFYTVRATASGWTSAPTPEVSAKTRGQGSY